MLYTYNTPHPAVATLCVVFGFDGRKFQLLLTQRTKAPFEGKWALPEGFVRPEETVEQCAARALREETGLTDVYMEQCKVYSEPLRDPRERTVALVFCAIVNRTQYNTPLRLAEGVKAQWFPLENVTELGFDHTQILADARAHMRMRFRTHAVAFHFLDENFSMSELQCLYELINAHPYDRRNFQRRALITGLLDQTSGPDAAEPLPDGAYIAPKRRGRKPFLFRLRMDDLLQIEQQGENPFDF